MRQVGKPRKKEETMDTLRSFFTEASTVPDTKTRLSKKRTETGIKDTFQMVFLEKLFASYKGKRKDARLDAVRATAATMDVVKTMSPVWCIHGTALSIATNIMLTLTFFAQALILMQTLRSRSSMSFSSGSSNISGATLSTFNSKPKTRRRRLSSQD